MLEVDLPAEEVRDEALPVGWMNEQHQLEQIRLKCMESGEWVAMMAKPSTDTILQAELKGMWKVRFTLT